MVHKALISGMRGYTARRENLIAAPQAAGKQRRCNPEGLQ